jgi:hypothetical protein
MENAIAFGCFCLEHSLVPPLLSFRSLILLYVGEQVTFYSMGPMVKVEGNKFKNVKAAKYFSVKNN